MAGLLWSGGHTVWDGLVAESSTIASEAHAELSNYYCAVYARPTRNPFKVLGTARAGALQGKQKQGSHTPPPGRWRRL